MTQFSRREVVAGLGGVGSLAASHALGPAGLFEWTTSVETTVPDGIWQEIDRDPRRSGYAPSGGPPTDATEQWSVEVDSALRGNYYRPGIVVGEQHVYMLETDALVAFDRETGHRAWRFEPPAVGPPSNREADYDRSGFAGWRGWLAYRDETVLVNGGSRGKGDTWPIKVLYAVDATDGSMNWAAPDRVGHAVLGESVLCASASGESSRNCLVHKETGRSRSISLPQTGDMLACFGTDDAHVFSFGGPTNKGIETVRSSVFEEDLVVSQSMMFGTTITSDGIALLTNVPRLGFDVDGDPDLVAVDLADRTHWPIPVEGTPRTPTVYLTDDEQWYVLTEEGIEAHPVSEAAARGPASNPTWQTAVPPVVGRPIVTDEGVYLPTEAGITVLDPSTGDKQGQFGPEYVENPPKWWQWAPAVVDGTLYCRFGDGNLHAYV